MSDLSLTTVSENLPVLLGSGPALARAEEFFFAHIENPNTRAAYERAVKGFFLYIRKTGVDHFGQVTPVVVSHWVQHLKESKLETATVKQKLAAVKGFLDYLATGGVIPSNPAVNFAARTRRSIILRCRSISSSSTRRSR